MPIGTSGSLRSQAIANLMTGGATDQPRRSTQPARPGLVLLAGWLSVLTAALMAVGAIPAYVGAVALCAVLVVAWLESPRQRARALASPDDVTGRDRSPAGPLPPGAAFDWEAFDDAREEWAQAAGS